MLHIPNKIVTIANIFRFYWLIFDNLLILKENLLDTNCEEL